MLSAALLEMIKKSVCSRLITVLGGLYFDQTSGDSSAIENISPTNRKIWAPPLLCLLYLLSLSCFSKANRHFQQSHISF